MNDPKKPAPDSGNRLLGSLRDALLAAGRTEVASDGAPERHAMMPAVIAELPAAAAAPAAIALPPPPADADTVIVRREPPPAAEAARDARAGAARLEQPTQRVRGGVSSPSPAPTSGRTQLVRGRVEVARSDFHQDPVVGWLVVVGGPGLGAFRPLFEGNNTIGRSRAQRVPIDFGDDSISSEEQAYIRYDSVDRSYLFVPNLAKTNIVSVNNKKPTGALPLSAMDVITMGRTQLAFVPFCGDDFDWSELGDAT